MRLFAGSSSDFISLNRNNQIAELLRHEFFKQLGYNPSHNEVMSWRNSLLRVSLVFQDAGLKDSGVFVEYQLPLSSKRIDVIVCGRDSIGDKQAVIIELKQWEKCMLTDYDSERVVTWVGGGNRDILHPAVQVGHYKYYLQENNSAFYEGKKPIKLSACSYLHNYNYYESDPIFDTRFSEALSSFPVYTSDDSEDLTSFIKNLVSYGEGMDVLTEIEKSKLRPSKKLLNQVSKSIRQKLEGELKIISHIGSKEDFPLIDGQLVAYDAVMSIVKKGFYNKQKQVIIVKGGMGTGKSVIALQLLADLAAIGRNAHYVTGSKAFTETLRDIIGIESKSLFKYTSSYSEAKPGELDVMIVDEAHRIREKTSYPFKTTGRSQVEDLIRAAKILVFFIDDYQVVREGEIGSSNLLKEESLRLNCKVYEFELDAQFRCGGSAAYANWIDNTLHIQRTANVLWKDEPNFEFKIFSTPEELEKAIREKHIQGKGDDARLMAGFCWPWSNEINADGSLIDDGQIGAFKRPWNARDGLSGLKKGIPQSKFWASKPGGFDQIGCVYTAQGFDFDYVGVIFGNDLVYNPEIGAWEGKPENSYDSGVKKSRNFSQLVKNTYRVLLGRARKGCYVYFVDKETEKFFRSRLDK